MSENKLDGINACVIGAGGYVGGEILSILISHPSIGRIEAVSPSRAGKEVSQTHPRLLGRLNARFAERANDKEPADVVFFATPARVAMEQAPGYLDAGSTVVDCSPDFRLKHLADWEPHYGEGHTSPELLDHAVYGLVELNREDLPGAKLIASPGCYATVVQLATVPVARELANAGCERLTIVADCVSGTSGAGRRSDRPELLMSEAGGNYSAYALGGHRHVPEMLAGIKKQTDIDVTMRFVPHLLPLPRGMFATAHFLPDMDVEINLGQVLSEAYSNERFIDVLPVNESPQVAAVTSSNRCQIGHTKEPLTTLGAIDNLGKGAAGQAVQAFNVAWGLPEWEGLDG